MICRHQMVIINDDTDRESEGDLTKVAELVTLTRVDVRR
jgi:3,4-dihydroxy-2-butanone 4-phosphate synthase